MTLSKKRAFLPLLILALVSVCLFPGPRAHSASAASKNLVYINKSGTSFLPLRVMNGYAGGSAVYDAAARQMTLTKDGVTLTLALGNAEASVNGTEQKLAAAPFRDNGTVYVPLAAVSGAFHLKLSWDNTAGAVTLTDKQGASLRLPVLNGTLLQPGSSAVTAAKKTVKASGRTFSIQVVTASLLHPSVRLDVVLAGGAIGRTEELRSMAKRSGAAAAINGTFFDAYTKGSYKTPYGYIAAGGKLLKNSPGDLRAVFAYDGNGLAEILPGKDFMSRFQAGGFEGALQAGPRLLADGKVSLSVSEEGFRDPKILTGGGARSALGLTRDHKLLLVTSSGATIPQMARIMLQAGAYQAMNLDGGASSGLYDNGKYLTVPGRPVSNALMVKLSN